MSGEASLVEVEIDVGRLNDPDHLVAEILTTVIHRVLGWLVGRRHEDGGSAVDGPRPRGPGGAPSSGGRRAQGGPPADA